MQASSSDRKADGMRVLVVDDDPSVATLTGEYLDREGEIDDVVVETDPRAALESVDSDARFDVVVCDYKLPAMDGLELFREVERRRPELPFVLFSGSAKYRLIVITVTIYRYDRTPSCGRCETDLQ